MCETVPFIEESGSETDGKESDNNSVFNGIAGRFMSFCERFAAPFRGETHKRKEPMIQYLKGLFQGNKGERNIERIAETVPDADEQALHHFISDSEWNEAEVLDLIASEADRHLGGTENSVLIIDESGFVKKGTKSAGVSRQWCGNAGKTENCQVAVYAALACDGHTVLIDEKLYLPESWVKDTKRCIEAGIPENGIIFKTKHELALEMICKAKKGGVHFSWVGFDAFYGDNPSFLRILDDMGEVFIGYIHKDYKIWIENPKPVIPPRKSGRGKTPSVLKAQELPIRVDEFAKHQPPAAWRRVKVRDSTKGTIMADILHRRVWVWDGAEENAREFHLVVRREVKSPDTVKYSLSNAPADTPLKRLVFMQGERYWVEYALRNGKQEAGMGDYQVRKWRGFHHHMALSMMAMLFMLEERLLNIEKIPILSCKDVRILLSHFLPRRDTTLKEILRQMEIRHKKRLSSVKSAYKRQENQAITVLDG